MSVVIPVYVDVESAFKDAANRVKTAITPIQKAIDDSVLQVKVSTGSGKKSTIQSIVDNVSQYSTTALEKAIQNVDRQLNTLYKKSKGSLDFSSGKAGDLVQAKIILEGQLEARKSITEQISKSVEEQKRLSAEEQEHRSKLLMAVQTMQDLTVKTAAWKAELQRTNLGDSNMLKAAAQYSGELERRMAAVNAQFKILGSNPGSIDQLRAKLAEINRDYQALSQSERQGAAGQQRLAWYRQISKELEKEVADLSKVIADEKAAAEAAAARRKHAADLAQQRKTENLVLATTAKNMKTLQEQERILSDRLSRATFGSQKYKDLQHQLERVQKTMQKMQGTVTRTNSLFSSQSAILRGLSSYASMYVSVFGFMRFVKQIRDVTGELEYQRVALGHLLQDVSFGNQLFDDIVEAAKKSPFRITQLVTYTKQLAAYQVEQDKLYDTTMRLADISAGLGVDMNRLILAYGQVRAASVLRGQELRQFTEAGIPLVELLAQKFRDLGREGTTTADVFKLISERAVKFSMIEEIFNDLTNAGGMFYKMQDEQAKTLKGRWEKLKDAYDQALMRLGENDTFQRWNDTVLKVLNGVAKNLTGIVRLLNAASIAWITYSIATNKAIVATVRETVAMIKQVGWHMTLKAAVEGVAASFRRLWIAMSKNWVALALTAFAGLIAFFTSFRNRTKDAIDELSDLEKEIEKMKDANKKLEFGKSLISDYEELAKKTDKTTEESNRMLDVVRELEKAYPELSAAIDYDNMTLRERIDIMNEVIDKSHELAVEEAKNRINEKKEVLRGYEEEAKQAKLKQDSARRRLEAAKTEEKTGGSGMVGGSDLVRDLAKETANAAKEADAATAKYDDLQEKIAKLKNEIGDLEKLIDPKKAEEGRKEWQNLLISMREFVDSKGFSKELFTVPDVEGWHTLGEAVKKMKPLYEEAKKSYESYMNAMKQGGEGVLSLEWKNEAKDAEAAFKAWEGIRITFGALWNGKETKGSDSRLSDLKNEISEATNAYKKYLELLKYMSKEQSNIEIAKLFPQLKGETPDLNRTLAFLEAKLKDVQEKIKKSPKDKVLLDMQRTLETEISNLKFDDLKRIFDEKLKELSAEVKRSEAARNLFNDLLGLTGDETLATTLTMQVYGQTGDEFKDRVQKEMIGALQQVKGITGDDFFNEMSGNVAIFDMEEIRRRIKEIPETVRPVFERLLEENDKYNDEVAKNYAKLLLKYDEMEQQRVNVTSQYANDIKTIENGLVLELEGIEKNKSIKDKETAKKRAQERADAAKEAVLSERDLQLSRLERNYRMFFSSVGVISDEAAATVAQNQKRMITDQFARGQKTLAQYKRELKEIDAQLEKYRNSRNMVITYLGGGFDAVADKIEGYGDGLLSIADNLKLVQKEGGVAFTDEDRAYIDKVGALMGGNLFGVSGRKNVAEELIAKVESISKTPEEFKKNMKDALAEAAKGASSFAMSMKQGMSTAGFWVSNVSTLIKELDQFNQDSMDTPKWLDTLASTVTWTLGVAGDEAWDRLANLNEYATSGFEKLSQGNIVGAIADNIRGLVDFWGPNIKKINREIEEQKNLLEELDYSYSRLEKAMDDSFGSDYIYNYNQQLRNLEAQQEAYLAQAEAERSKGKKADKNAIKDYEKAARDAGDKIADMRTQLAEFFAGTDLTSAAEDFANAWIDAYKEFGSVTDAMSEKFQDMIESMINKSLAAKIMQEMLSPIFDQIDALMTDSILSTEDIAAIADLAQSRIPLINDAMTNLMTSLASAGYDVRTSTAGLSGISKGYASASEESILGLSAGINTQNYYMSYMPVISENVGQILSILSGGSAAPGMNGGETVGEEMPSVQRMVYDHLPNIDMNMAEMLRLFKSVITTKNGATNSNRVAVM